MWVSGRCPVELLSTIHLLRVLVFVAFVLSGYKTHTTHHIPEGPEHTEEVA